MLSVTVDDILLSYRDELIRLNFYEHLSTAFDITTPTNTTKLKFLSLTLFQSETGTSIDQTNHIKSSILSPWFDHGHPTKITNTPFPIDSTFEHDLATSPPLQGNDLTIYEERYHGPDRKSVV